MFHTLDSPIMATLRGISLNYHETTTVDILAVLIDSSSNDTDRLYLVSDRRGNLRVVLGQHLHLIVDRHFSFTPNY